MVNHNYSGSRNHRFHDDRGGWLSNDEQLRSDRDREDERWASERNRSSYPDHDSGNFGRDRDRDTMTEGYGQGQSGYSAGRHGDDRSQGYQNRNQSYLSGGYGYSDRQSGRSGMGLDDRFSGRGGDDWAERSDYHPDRLGGYGSDRSRETGYRGSRMGYGGMAGSSDSGRFESGRSSFGTDYSGYGGSSFSGYGHQRGMTDHRGMIGGRGMEAGRGMDDRGMSPDRGMSADRGMGAERGMGGHRGKGPQNWQRSDERIRESVCEALADHDQIDASNIQVTIKDGEVTLAGTVEDRRMKRLAEDCVEQISGVKEVQNHIRIQSSDSYMTGGNAGSRSSTTTPSATGNDRDKDKDKQLHS